jgi:hypothetical protein
VSEAIPTATELIALRCMCGCWRRRDHITANVRTLARLQKKGWVEAFSDPVCNDLWRLTEEGRKIRDNGDCSTVSLKQHAEESYVG